MVFKQIVNHLKFVMSYFLLIIITRLSFDFYFYNFNSTLNVKQTIKIGLVIHILISILFLLALTLIYKKAILPQNKRIISYTIAFILFFNIFLIWFFYKDS